MLVEEMSMALGVDDLAMNVVGSAIFEGLRRPVRSFRAFATRRAEIIKAIEGKDTSSRGKTDPAFDDLVRVLGNEYGQYTEAVDRFLFELRTSAIPSTIYGLVLCGRPTDEIFPAFQTLYETFSPLPFSCESLFRAISAAIKSRIETLSNEPMLLDAIRASSDEIRGEILSISAALSRAKHQEALSPERFVEARDRISRSVEVANRDLPVETSRGTKRIGISRLVIPARLQSTNSQSPAPALGGESITLREFRLLSHRGVVLGDPGGGKSTLTQLICYELAKGLTGGVQAKSRSFEDRDVRLPLRLIVRTLDKRQRNNPGYSILDYFRDELRPTLDNDAQWTEAFLSQTLSTGKAFLLFDGLDEVLEVGRRREVAANIEQFSNAYAACPVVVTSRVVGYHDAPLPDEFNTYLLARLSKDEVEKFAEKLIKVLGDKEKNPTDEAKTFIRQTDTNASDRRENPLLLGLMVHLFIARGDVPDNRPEIYQACSHLLFLRWDQRRDIKFEYPDDFELMDLFGHLAAEIFGNADAEDGVSEQWLLGRVKHFFEEWYSDRARAATAARALVTFITGRAWVMCDVGPSIFKFTHRTFLEYFVARRLESESDSVSDLLQTLYPRIIKAEWDVVCHLAIQIAASSGPKAVRAVDGLLALLSSQDRTPEQEINVITFTAHALEYLAVPEPKYRTIVNELIDRVVGIGSTYSIATIGILSVLVSKSRKKGAILKNVMEGTFGAVLENGSVHERRFVKFVLAARSITYRSPRSDSAFFTSFYTRRLVEMTRSMTESRQNVALQEAINDVYDARIYLMTYNDRYSEIWKAHGDRLLFYASDPMAPDAYNQLRQIVLGQCIVAVDSSEDDAIDKLAFVKAFLEKAIKEGILVKKSTSISKTDVRESLNLIDFLFRDVYFAWDRRRKAKERTLHLRDCAGLLCACVELIFLVNHSAFENRYAERERDVQKRGLKRNRQTNMFIPASYWMKVVDAIDDAAGDKVFEAWMQGKASFLSAVASL